MTKPSRIGILLGFALFLWLPSISQQTPGDVKYFNIIEKLHADLLTSYNKQIRPVLKHTDTLSVDVSPKPINIDYDDIQGRISVRAYTQMIWKDPRFKWAPASYEGLESIHVPSNLVWTPDLEVYNLDGKLSADRTFASTEVLIKSDGTVIYVPLTNFVARCDPNFENWPYDKQTCNVTIGSWTHDVQKIRLMRPNNETTVDVTDMVGPGTARWDLLSTAIIDKSKQYSCCKEFYQSLTYTFVIQRRSAAAVFTIITPTLVIVALTLVTFFIPPMVGSKLVVGVINVLLLCAYLIHFNSVLPSSQSIPMIVEFYGATLILTAISIISSIATFSWTRLPKSRPPPATLLRCFTCLSFNRLLGVKLPKAQTAEEEKLAENKNMSDTNAQQQWIYLSLALHRILFGVYCIVFAVLIKCCLF